MARGLRPETKTMRYLQDRGYLVGVTEQKLGNFRKDLFGMFDLVAIKEGKTYGIQVTSASNISSRRKKILESDNLEAVRLAGWGIVLHGWKGDTLKEEML